MPAVITGTTFSLKDVRTNVSQSSCDRLSTIFTDVVQKGYDINYCGSKDRLSNFRNFVLATGITTPVGVCSRCLAFDGTNWWVAGYLAECVVKITPTGQTSYTGTGSNPYGIAFDGTNMWTANNGDNSVTKITPNGTMTTYSSTGSQPKGIAYDGTNMWTSNYNGNSVTKITPSGTMTTYTSTGVHPNDIAFDGSAYMWTSNEDCTVSKIAISDGTITTYSGMTECGLHITTDGTNAWSGNKDGISKITPAGVVTNWTIGFTAAYGIAYDGSYLWVTDGSSNTVGKINPANPSSRIRTYDLLSNLQSYGMTYANCQLAVGSVSLRCVAIFNVC